MRPEWDERILTGLGFTDVTYVRDITGPLWDDKEKLLFGATPMFMVAATKV